MPTKRRDIVRKVGRFGGWEDERRGKGGHRLLRRRDPEVPARMLAYPLRFHGGNEDIPDSVVRALRRKLKLTPDHGVSDAAWDEA
jgi:hypothetical protein